jgi:hypothetical protein
MRMLGAGFGLVALLITVAIMAKLWSDEAAVDSQADKQALQQVQQIAGVTSDGTHIEDTYDLTAQTGSDGRIRYLDVSRLQPNSPLATFFGLKLNDQITAAEYQSVTWKVNEQQDEESAKLSVREAYTHGGQLTVVRTGQTLTLPTPAQSAQINPQQQSSQSSTDPLKSVTDQLHSLQGN